MSKQEIRHALRNWLGNGVLLGAAAIISLAIFQGKPFSSAAARYVAFWIVLPTAWLIAMWFTHAVREFVLARYDDLGSTPRRVVAGGAVAVAFIAYLATITSNIPEGRQHPQDTQPVTSVALIP
jgi:hypothetical protein